MSALKVRIPDGFVDELKARLRPSDIIGRKVKLKKQGKEWVGLSPFTNEKSPSFYVNDQKKIFKCFSSGLGGDVLTFVMETERLSFMEAVEKLAEEAGMSLPKATPEDRESYDRRQRLYQVCEVATDYFQSILASAEGQAAQNYLATRGLARASWPKYRLGFAPDDWRKTFEYLRAHGFSRKEIVEAGLAVEKDGGGEPYDRFRGRLMFPIEDRRGQVIAFGGRALEADAKPKYLNSSDTSLFHKSKVLYRYKAAREAFSASTEEGLIVCEGYMDVIALCEAGLGYAVAPLGTALTQEQLALLWQAGSEPVVCFDGDSAGLNAQKRVANTAMPYLSPKNRLKFCVLPAGRDPDDILQQDGGREVFLEAIHTASPFIDYIWEDLEQRDYSTPERQAEIEMEIREVSSSIKDAATSRAYFRSLSERFKRKVWQSNRQKYARTEDSKDHVSLRGIRRIRGLSTLAYLIHNSDVIEEVDEVLGSSNFQDPYTEAIKQVVLKKYAFFEEISENSVIKMLAEELDGEAISYISEQLQLLKPEKLEARTPESIIIILKAYSDPKKKPTLVSGYTPRQYRELMATISDNQYKATQLREMNSE